MSKRLMLANILLRCGAGVIGRLKNRDRLFVFNYHRIRPDEGPLTTEFDDGVFGPAPGDLRQILQFIQKHTTVLDESGLQRLLNGDRPGRGPYSMVTFDDAYADNYDLALPILRELGVPAIFFAPAYLIEERTLGWWDRIAYIVKRSSKEEITLRGEKLPLAGRKQEVIRRLQQVMKLQPHGQTINLIDELAQAAGSPPPGPEVMGKELMTWDQLGRAHEAGITIGSHTCRHWVLATLSPEQQAEEIIDSKGFIEKRLGIKVRSLAFPVGGVDHFNQATLSLVEEAGYDLAFSYHTGLASLGRINPYSIPRLGTPDDLAGTKAVLSFPRLMDYSAAHRRRQSKARS